MNAGIAKTIPPRNQKPTLKGRFATAGGSCEVILGSSTSLIDCSNGMKAEIRNTRPNTKEPTPSDRTCTRSSQGAVFQLCFENAKLNVPTVMVTAHRQRE